MPKNFRRKKRSSGASHKVRINKTKNYNYHNPGDVKAKVGDEDVAGQGHFYCETCSRHFKSQEVLCLHEASKDHKKGVKKRKFDQDMDRLEEERLRDYQVKRMKTTDVEMG